MLLDSNIFELNNHSSALEGGKDGSFSFYNDHGNQENGKFYLWYMKNLNHITVNQISQVYEETMQWSSVVFSPLEHKDNQEIIKYNSRHEV